MEKPRIAVILPPGKRFDRTFEAIAATEKDFGTQCVRVFTDLSLLAATLKEFADATMIIADLTGRNPDVMFLTGYALGLNKKVTFISKDPLDFPFDQSTDPIVYGLDFTSLADQLVFRHCGCNSLSNRDSKQDARTKFLSIFGDLLQKHQHEHRGPILEDQPNIYTLINQDMDLPLVQ